MYEPPISVHPYVRLPWLDRFDREVAAGKVVDALITALKGIDIEPVLGKLPRFVLKPLMSFGIKAQDADLGPDDVSIRLLVPAQKYDNQVVSESHPLIEAATHLQA